MPRRALALCCAGLAGIASLAALVFPAQAIEGAGSAADGPTSTYLVLLRGEPVAVALAPSTGHRLHAMSAAARAYRTTLLAEQADVREPAGVDDVLYAYTTVLDGFAARLTPIQVTALQSNPDVASVQASQLQHLDSVAPGRQIDPGRASGALTLAHTHQAWHAVGGVGRAGRGIVVGVVDSGIWPESPSFAGVPLSHAELHKNYPRFHGSCDEGQQWSTSVCDDKIVGARSFVADFGADQVSSTEYLSPRDATGHGSRVAAIAAGNAGVDVTIDGQAFGRIGGIAPDAGIAVYKACWTAPNPSGDGCTSADTVAAIDRAVEDGVDVLNVSVSGPSEGPGDAVELAFLGAATAGVFVATSAGDQGPSAATVAHPSPWVTTVAASTQTSYEGGVRLGDGRLVIGAMASDRRVADAPLVDARQSRAPDATKTASSLCEPGALDAAEVDGAIVVCARGTIARVDKSAAVKQAGGVGMVLVNTSPGTIDPDIHAVPTVHLDESAGRAVLAYVHNAKAPHASLDPDASRTTTVPRLADFSGRGPAAGTGADVVKPDLSAPGVSIVSAVAPATDDERLWDLASGTSMAAPQVAGVAALVMQAHSRWSPAEVKSALMTTAVPLADTSTPFGHGAGNVRPDRALDPGLVYGAGRPGWLAYLEGQGVHVSDAEAASATDPSDLNQASIAVGSLVGRQTVTRRVTNVSGHVETYTATVTGLRGVAARVAPSTLRLGPGQTRQFRVTLTAQRGATYTGFVSGQLRWTGSSGHIVSSPVVVRPESFAAPDELTSASASGQLSIRGTAGVTGTLRASIVGASTAVPLRLDLTPGPFDTRQPSTSALASVRQYSIGAGTAVARFDVSALSDVNLYVYRSGRLLAAAASTSDSERVTLEHPAAGVYDVYVVAPAGLGDAGGPVAATYTAWIVRRGTTAGLRVAQPRAKATGLEPVGWQLRWSPRPAGSRTLAELRFRGASAHTHVTIG